MSPGHKGSCLLNGGHPQAEKIKMLELFVCLSSVDLYHLGLLSSGVTIIQQKQPPQAGLTNLTSINSTHFGFPLKEAMAMWYNQHGVDGTLRWLWDDCI